MLVFRENSPTYYMDDNIENGDNLFKGPLSTYHKQYANDKK